MPKELTPQQVKLVKGIVAGKSKRVAALEAGYGSNPNSAGAIANETLRIPNVKEALLAALDKAGITPEKVMQPVVDALNDPDLEMRLKGHDRATKVIGVNQKTEGGNTINNFGTMISEMKNKYND